MLALFEGYPARVYLTLILKNYVFKLHGLTVYVKEGLPSTCFLSLEISRFLLGFWQAFIQCPTSFSCINHVPRLCTHILMLFHLM